MLENFLKTAFRAFRKNKWVSLINVFGLAVGMSAALVIFLVARYDLTFDRFEPGGNRVYRVVTNFTFMGSTGYNPGVCNPLPAAAKSDVSGLELVVPVYQPMLPPDVGIPSASGASQTFRQAHEITFTTPDYFNLIPYRWLAGVPAVLAEPYRTVLTASQAERYFPGLAYDEMIGRTVTYDSVKTTVAGIVAPLKENSGFSFHDLISYSTLMTNYGLRQSLRLGNWGATSSLSQLFVRLSPGGNPGAVTAQLNGILAHNLAKNPHKTQTFALQPLSDIHLSSTYGGIADHDNTASRATLYGLMAIAVFLLLLACINFINLSTAQAGQRAKEVGIRKTIGSSRARLVRQFLGETMLMTASALVLSVLLAPNLLKLFAGFVPAGVHLDLQQPYLWWFALALVMVVGLAAGIYPALVLSGYKPVAVLKNQALPGGRSRSSLLRKSLTVSQFVIAQFFVIATALVSKQIYYATHKDLGFNKDAVVILQTPEKASSVPQNKLLLGQLRAIPGVTLVSLGYDAPSSGFGFGTEASYHDGKREVHMEDLAVKFGDENYLRVYRIPLLAGRNLLPADTGRGFLVNEVFVHRIGLQRPQEAVGKVVDGYNGNQRMTIVGVVADFNEGSLHDAISPMALMTSNDVSFSNTFHIALPRESGEWAGILARIRQAYHSFYPDDPAVLQFVDESIARLYEKEAHTATLLRWATGLSILISCLGLLGLAIFSTAQRMKEIGVRKVLGASAAGIVLLLSKEILVLTVLALVIAIPAAVFALNKWLADFADRTNLSWWVFLLCGIGITLVALLISAFQTVRAALANPAKSLRSE
jgi:ABC-type antimicrobial peptide transport system permease subunit